MCRLTAYCGPRLALADLVTRPARSVIRQSFDARERLGGLGAQVYEIGRLNADGFGIGWYPDQEEVLRELSQLSPCVFKELGPAWNNANLINLCERTSSELIFAHVRAAGPGMGVSRGSCHPFWQGRFLWMHNGQVSGFGTIRRELLDGMSQGAYDFSLANGCTDSSVSFALFLDHVGWDKLNEPMRPEDLSACLRATIKQLTNACDKHQVKGTSLLNFVVSDGVSMAASRCIHSGKEEEHGGPHAAAASLYYSSGSQFEQEECRAGPLDGWGGQHQQEEKQQQKEKEEVRRYRMTRKRLRDRVVIITSEPLTETNADWVSIPTNFVVLVTPEKQVLMSHIDQLALYRVLELRSSAFPNILARTQKNAPSLPECCTGVFSSPTSASRSSSSSSSSGGGGGGGATSPRSPTSATFDRRLSRRLSSTQRGFVEPTADAVQGAPFFFQDSHRSAVLSLAALGDFIVSADCASSTENRLVLWDLDLCRVVQCLPLSAGVMALCAYERDSSYFLFAACTDSVIYCWKLDQALRLEALSQLRVQHAGHLHVLAARDEKLLVGSQDGCVRCVELDPSFFSSRAQFDLQQQPDKKENAAECGRGGFICLFGTTVAQQQQPQQESAAPGQGKTILDNNNNNNDDDGNKNNANKQTRWHTGATHMGAVTSLLYSSTHIISASVDGVIIVWSHGLEKITELWGHCDAVFSLCLSENEQVLFSASMDSTIRVWDLVTGDGSIRRVLPCGAPVSCVAVHAPWLVSSHTNMQVEIRDLQSLVPTGDVLDTRNFGLPIRLAWRKSKKSSEPLQLACGTSRGTVCTWNLARQKVSHKAPSSQDKLFDQLSPDSREDFFAALRDLVSIESVSANVSKHEECWVAAKFLERMLSDFLCCDVVRMCSDPANPRPPVVIGSLCSKNKPVSRRLVIYGHYDVVSATAANWDTDPFEMAAKDGYLYGRGTTDDKGPLMACIFAAKNVMASMSDDVGITFVLEGQEESGQSRAARGFDRVLEANSDMFENTCGVLVSNNYWIDDKRPCLTYGMRGVIDLEVQVRGSTHNLHSGVHGGALFEPSEDLVAILGSLTIGGGEIAIDGLKRGVRPLDDEQKRFYNDIALNVERYRQQVGSENLYHTDPIELLHARWSKPCLSISSIHTSNTNNAFRMIPCSATARISMHFVPDQNAQELEQQIVQHLKQVFKQRHSANALQVNVCQVSDWWLGDTESKIFKLARTAIQKVWGVPPLHVREGGSYGGISSFMQKFCDAPVLHLPLGQATDSAHLPNERISVENLLKGKMVIEEIIRSF